MTTTPIPTPTPTPLPAIPVVGIMWTIQKGCASDAPILDQYVFYDSGDTCVDEQDPLHSRFRWNTVEIEYNNFGNDDEGMVGFRISGRGFRGLKDPITGETMLLAYLPNPIVYTITNNHPINYGVDLFVNANGCGITDNSLYNYVSVFDKTDFAYLPMNSGNNVDEFKGEYQLDGRNDRFPLEPEYPELTDPKGKAAPIFPMDAITRFSPDPRESVTITYEVTGLLTEFDELVPVLNSKIIIKQTVVQNVGNYEKQLNNLMSHTMLGNDLDVEYSDEYPYSYPYTLVNGFNGLSINETPKTRGIDRDNSPLQRGDVWFDPLANQRKYYNTADIPDTLTIINKGSNYRQKTNVPCIWQPKDICVEIDERPIPYGLLVDLELINGKVENVSISEDAMPVGFMDGDEVSINGGDGQARLRINIVNPQGWINKYVSQY